MEQGWEPSVSGTRVIDSDHQIVCDLGWKPAEVRKARANLIAAAPDLHYCLKRIIDDLPYNRDWFDPVVERLAKIAIAKAEGKQICGGFCNQAWSEDADR